MQICGQVRVVLGPPAHPGLRDRANGASPKLAASRNSRRPARHGSSPNLRRPTTKPENTSGKGIVLTTFEWIIGLLLGAVGLSALARRLGIPYPTFLAIGGAVLAFAPGAPQWTLEPD